MQTSQVRCCSWLLILLLPLPLAWAQAVAQADRITAVDAVGMTVSDLDRAVTFYSEVLTFEQVNVVEVSGAPYERLQGLTGVRMRTARLRLGDETIALTVYSTPKGRPIPADARSNDQWFQHIAIIVSDMDRAYQRLKAYGVVHVSPAPQRLPDWNPNAGGIRAFYFRDPDGHVLEILQFPPDKGLPKWQRPSTRLFLGIDHTAVVVRDTDQSLRFYRDTLGFRVVGASENYGPEQERLNNVPGAHLRITALRVAQGPGIELLEYLTPRDGRPLPDDARPNDLMHWQTSLITRDIGATEEALRRVHAVFVSSGVVTLPARQLGFQQGVLVRGPDGHVMQVTGK